MADIKAYRTLIMVLLYICYWVVVNHSAMVLAAILSPGTGNVGISFVEREAPPPVPSRPGGKKTNEGNCSTAKSQDEIVYILPPEVSVEELGTLPKTGRE